MPALAGRCRNKPAAHKYPARGFPGRFKEMIQLVPRGSFPAAFPPRAADGNRNGPCALGAACQPAGMRGTVTIWQGAVTCWPLHIPQKLFCAAWRLAASPPPPRGHGAACLRAAGHKRQSPSQAAIDTRRVPQSRLCSRAPLK